MHSHPAAFVTHFQIFGADRPNFINCVCRRNSRQHLDKDSAFKARNNYISIEQVAQLWQRDCAKLDKFAIHVRLYSQTHAQHCFLGPLYGGIRSI